MKNPLSEKDIKGLTYEQAFAELEAIIENLEANQELLDKSITLFERGQALAQYCTQLLDKAELRVQQLNRDDIALSE